ncbi:MAG: hypothetical protein H6867_07195 [Rhodospirillales bacterium]|nr:hypothetical protein [Rhodospirillales bacterium]MCB9995336.1 hypothetical protein [Rhodospirillales bacterium]
MEAEIKDPLTDLNEHVPATVKKFDFARPPITVGRSTLAHREDPEIYDGTTVTTSGYFRIARHIPTGTLCLLSSKAPQNLRGKRESHKGPIIATKEGLNYSYIVAAFRSSGKDEDTYKISSQLRRAMFRYGENLGERCEKHFTLYGANLTNPDSDTRIFNTDTPTELWTNGRLAYLLDQTKEGRWTVTFYAPVRRKDGSFVPVTLGKNKLADRFAKVSRVISNSHSYAQARQDMAEHWQKISSRLWDEQNIYEGEGLGMRTSYHAAKFIDKMSDHGPRLAFVTTAVGLTLGAFNPKYGLIGGLVAATIHTIMDHIADESYSTSRELIKRTNEARKRLNIDSYPFNEDVSNHFKIQTPDNIARLCAKLDLDRFPAEEFELLDSKRAGLLRDHEFITDGFRPDSLKDQVLSMHQRGFSSTCVLPDRNTRLDMFQSGLVRLMHTLPDGEIRMYSGYRADICVEEKLRLPQEYIERLQNGIVANEYDRRRENFNHAFRPYELSVDEMMDEIAPTLFRDQPDINDAVKLHSIQSIRDVFGGCTGERIPAKAISQHPSLPDLRAIL